MTTSIHLLSSLKNISRDDHALNLRRSFDDLKDFGIAHQLLDRIFRAEAVATENLNSIAGDLVSDIGGVAFGD